MESSDITVYTCITGGKDGLIDDQVGDCKFTAYLDIPQVSKKWDIKTAYDKFEDNRRNSRAQKILTHKYIHTKYSIYLDGNIKLLVSPEKLIEKYLKNHDIALFKHPVRDCLYDEALICAKRDLDDPETIIRQVKEYEDSGFAKHKGLYECGIILRRHTPKVEQLNNTWWAEFCTHSKRDQISFAYAVDRVGIRVNGIPDPFIDRNGVYTRADEFEIVYHKIPTTKNG